MVEIHKLKWLSNNPTQQNYVALILTMKSVIMVESVLLHRHQELKRVLVTGQEQKRLALIVLEQRLCTLRDNVHQCSVS